jgi:nucleotide-binding universal stress UspA family protein/predicted transcriptional regulator
MTKTHKAKVLFPVDLSANSLAALELAGVMARQHDAMLSFIHVAPPRLPQEAMIGSDEERSMVKEDMEAFLQLRPADPETDHEHIYLQGNPGPEIVKASAGGDLLVMATHGHGALLRLLMGSVAQYVLRHARCPVILYKDTPREREIADKPRNEERFVTGIMHHVRSVHDFEKMPDVLAELSRARETAAPVVDDSGYCIGILTQSDIDHYRQLQKRCREQDESVIEEIFETNEFGQRRTANPGFDQVRRHMTSPVITITDNQSIEAARQMLARYPGIHHLVVVDEENRPVGIIDVSGRSDRSLQGADAHLMERSHHAEDS